MKIAYENWSPNPETYALVRKADQISAEYEAQGYDLTLRQLYYQFVARDVLPNSDKSYKRLGTVVNNARLAGMLDWDRITDRTRNLRKLPAWDSPASIIRSVAHQFNVDLWEGQPTRVEVWVEKEALAGVIQRAADEWGVPWFSCRGYVSQSEMWAAGQRIANYLRDKQRVIILHLGDHDPSGIDMSRDITDRLDKFVFADLAEEYGLELPTDVDKADLWDIEGVKASIAEDVFEDPWSDQELLEVRRIALNMPQIRVLNPPPNPAKITDSRAAGYIEAYGAQSWELDALDPATLAGLIRTNISDIVDHERYGMRMDLRDEGQELLTTTSQHWGAVVDFVRSQ